MILPDVNILVYAFRADTTQHARCAAWLSEMAERGSGLAMCDAVISGFLRVVTHPRVFSTPAPMAEALDFVRWLIESPGLQWLSSSQKVWSSLESIAVSDRGVRGNLVPDAYLAALCLAHRATIATSDRGFARFEGLRIFDPVTAQS